LFAGGEPLYQVVLQGVESLVCSVGLWRLLGNNKKPENQEAADNKEEAKQGKRSEWSDFAEAGADQVDCCDMLSFSHFRLVKCYTTNIAFPRSMSRGKVGNFSFSYPVGPRKPEILRCST